MINIKNKKDCVGCNACVQICPKSCINFENDSQGFSYPHVDLLKCINCKLCEKVCPVLNQSFPHIPIATYAAKNSNSLILASSSSGGVFTALAEKIIKKGGVVFGARFDKDWNVIHDYTEDIEGIQWFQRSKYVQSHIGECYKKVKEFLETGRYVLFSGTPCQLAGLNRYLRKDYGDLLIKIDTICHGVPSAKLWQSYLHYLSHKFHFSFSSIDSINFRDKRNGWDDYGMSIKLKESEKQSEIFIRLEDNIYMQGFLYDLYLRPSCYACPAKEGKSTSDITLGDFWGIQKSYPKYYSNQFFSLVLANSPRGMEFISSLENIESKDVSFKIALKYNPSINKSPKQPQISLKFWKDYQDKGFNVLPKILKSMQPTLIKKIYIRTIFLISSLLRSLNIR